MDEVTLFFEVDGLAVDEYGNPAPAGMKMTLTGVDPKAFDRASRETLIEYVEWLSGFDRDRLHILTAEEYDKEYGDKDPQDERMGDDD